MNLRCSSCAQRYSVNKLPPLVENRLNEEWQRCVEYWKKSGGEVETVSYGHCYSCASVEIKTRYRDDPVRMKEKLEELEKSHNKCPKIKFGSQYV